MVYYFPQEDLIFIQLPLIRRVRHILEYVASIGLSACQMSPEEPTLVARVWYVWHPSIVRVATCG